MLAACQLTATAQSSTNSGATQNTTLQMAELVSADFFDNGGNGGSSTVELPLGGANTLEEGVESPEIEVILRCTTDFDLSVKASATNFTYAGSSTQNTTMPVEDVLAIVITENNTGGNVSNGMTQYKSISGSQGKTAISAGKRGETSFKFKYKATPGFNYAAGTYTTDIVYTLTKK